jgi:prepilin-type N-terminal cleavage/methylation domain-containing protein
MRKNQASGFTLVELVASLLVLGIMAAVVGLGVAAGFNIFATARENSVMAQKAQMAMTRLTRELQELTGIVEIPIGSSNSILYDKLDGRHAIAVVNNTVKLYAADNLTTLTGLDLATNGNVLINQVSNLTLRYHAGNVPGHGASPPSPWTTGNDIRTLSAIEIDLDLSRTTGPVNTLTFSAMVHPRNINSFGGAVAGLNPVPPTQANYCFISTAMAPKGFHGFWIILAGTVFLTLLAVVHKKTGGKRSVSAMARRSEDGSALIWIIIALIIFSALAAAMLPMISTSGVHQVAGNFSDRAYYLAESGYRYAASLYLNAADTAAENDALGSQIHQKTYQLAGNDGQFGLQAYPYFFEISSRAGNTITTHIPGGFPYNPPNVTDYLTLSSTGKLYIGTEVFNYSSITANPPGTTVTFALDRELALSGVGSNALMVATSLPNDQTVNQTDHDYIALNGNSGDSFPLQHAEIIIGSHVYAYRRNDRGANRLIGIFDPADSNMAVLTVPANTDLVLNKFVQLESTGTYGSGNMQTSRRLIYHTPLPITEALEQRFEFHDRFESTQHWITGIGTHAIETIDEDNALRVTGAVGGPSSPRASLTTLNWSTTPVNLQNVRAASKGYLNYTAQVKVGFAGTATQPAWGYDPESPTPEYYAAGLVFRLDDSANCYGLSLLRGSNAQTTPFDNIPNPLVPKDNVHTLVLWQATGSRALQDESGKQWLAYKQLDAYTDDMESGSGEWAADSPWTLASDYVTMSLALSTHNHINSRTHSWRTSPVYGSYANNLDSYLVTPTVSITAPCNVQLEFSHYLDVSQGDTGEVQVSLDNGTSWQTLKNFTSSDNTGQWQAVTADLGSFPATTEIKARFRFQSDALSSTADGWYIDDVSIVTLPVHLSTLAVRISEAASLTFVSGGPAEIHADDVITGATSGAVGRVMEPPLLSNADWAGGDAQGLLRLEMINGAFSTGENLNLAMSGNVATVTGYRERENLIRAYYGTHTACGSGGDTDRFNYNRLANERVTETSTRQTLAWPAEPDQLWTAETDHFIQIQWDDVNSAAVTAVRPDTSASAEPGAIIRAWASDLIIPAESTLDVASRPEIGLHTFGKGAENIFFDDFGLLSIVRLAPTTITGTIQQ